MIILLRYISLTSFIFFLSSQIKGMEQTPSEYKSCKKFIKSIDPKNCLASLPALEELIKKNPKALHYLQDTVLPQWFPQGSFTSEEEEIHQIVTNEGVVAFLYKKNLRCFGCDTRASHHHYNAHGRSINTTVLGSDPFSCITITPDAKYVIAASDTDIVLYNPDTGKLKKLTLEKFKQITALAAFNNKIIAIGDSKGSVAILKTYEKQQHVVVARDKNSPAITGLEWLSEDSLISLDEQGHPLIHSFDSTTGKYVTKVFNIHFDKIKCHTNCNHIFLRSENGEANNIIPSKQQLMNLSLITHKGTLVMYENNYFKRIKNPDEDESRPTMQAMIELDLLPSGRPLLKTTGELIPTYLLEKNSNGYTIFKKSMPNKKQILFKIGFEKTLKYNADDSIENLYSKEL